MTAALIGRGRDFVDKLDMPATFNAYFLRNPWGPDGEAPKLSRFRMLSLTQQYKVLGGRDSACSLLGLLSKANGSAPSLTDCAVDYMKTLSQSYLDVAKKIVEQDGSLSKLGCVQHFDSSGHLHTPSRVPRRHYRRDPRVVHGLT